MKKSSPTKPAAEKPVSKPDPSDIGGQPENDQDARDAGLSSATPEIDAAKSKEKDKTHSGARAAKK